MCAQECGELAARARLISKCTLHSHTSQSIATHTGTISTPASPHLNRSEIVHRMNMVLCQESKREATFVGRFVDHCTSPRFASLVEWCVEMHLCALTRLIKRRNTNKQKTTNEINFTLCNNWHEAEEGWDVDQKLNRSCDAHRSCTKDQSRTLCALDGWVAGRMTRRDNSLHCGKCDCDKAREHNRLDSTHWTLASHKSGNRIGVERVRQLEE